MFGKAYLAAMGLMLFVIGTGLSLVTGITSEACAKIASMPKGFEIVFNPCDIFALLPTAALAMQALGIIIAGTTIFFIVKGIKKTVLKCPNCKEKAPEKSAFCPKCGTKLGKKIKPIETRQEVQQSQPK